MGKRKSKSWWGAWASRLGKSGSLKRRTGRSLTLRGLETLEDRTVLSAAPLDFGVADWTAKAPQANDRMPGELLVGFRAGVSENDIRGLYQAHRVTEIERLYGGENSKAARRVAVPEAAIDALARALSRDPRVEYAEPNYVASTFWKPNDTYYSYQWHLQNPAYGGINMEAAWDASTGSGVVVAVLDTGVAYENYQDATGAYYVAPDLTGTRFVPGYDFINNDSHANDDHSHGTHVAGTIAQSTNNSRGAAGVAFNASVMPVKVLGRDGSGSHSAIAQGVRFAADNGAHIINLSLGSSSGSQTLHDALAYAYGKGVTIVAAAGNDGLNSVSYPAAYDNYVIAVSATRYDEKLASYSNYGASIDLAAPGGDVSVDQNRDGYPDGVLQNTFDPNTKNPGSFGYYFMQGTSMAAPHVAGAAALVASSLLATKGAADPALVRSILQSTAKDRGAIGVDPYYGHGIIDAAAALAAVKALNSAPIAQSDSAVTDAGKAVTIPVLANDSDPDGDALTVASFTAPANGTVVKNADNTLTYTPHAGFSGTNTFQYTAADPSGATATASVTVTVNPAAAASSFHVADIDGSVSTNKNKWRAQVVVTIVDAHGKPLSGATVSGSWSDGLSFSGKTDSLGRVVAWSNWQVTKTQKITFSVTNVVYSDWHYHKTANQDPDGDSNGTQIVVNKDGTTAAPSGLVAQPLTSASSLLAAASGTTTSKKLPAGKTLFVGSDL